MCACAIQERTGATWAAYRGVDAVVFLFAIVCADTETEPLGIILTMLFGQHRRSGYVALHEDAQHDVASAFAPPLEAEMIG